MLKYGAESHFWGQSGISINKFVMQIERCDLEAA